jgi:hypothetical protein
MLGIKTTTVISTGNSRGGFSASALAWKAKIIANGGTISDAILAKYDTNFFTPAEANGNILTQADRLHIYVGLSGYEIAAKTSVVGSFLATKISTPVFDDNGVKSDGVAGCLNLNYNQTTHGVKFTLNDNILFAIVKTPPFSGNVRVIGNNYNTGKNCYIRRTSTPNIQIRNSGSGSSTNATTTNSNTSSTGNVYLASKRTGSANAIAKINANEASGTNASYQLDSATNYELTTFDGGAAGEFDTSYHRCSGHTSSSFDEAAFRTMIDNLCNAFGV